MLSPHDKLFQKIKRGLEQVSLPHFWHNFQRKIFLLLYSINWPNFTVWFSLLCEILGNMCIAIACKPGCENMNFEVNLIFLIKPFFPTWPKSCDKNLNTLRMKRLFKIKYKAFSIISKGLSIKQRNFFWLVGVPL